MNENILLVDSFYPINTRNDKIITSLRNAYPLSIIHVVAWNREERVLDLPEGITYHIYTRKSPGGKLFKKALNLKGYYSFFKKINKEVRPKLLIASHWDMLFFAVLCKGRQQVLLYDNLDIPSAPSILLLWVMKYIERMSIKYVDIVVFASRFYQPLYRYNHSFQFVLENKPVVEPEIKSVLSSSHTPIIISFIGVVRYIEILRNLVDAVKGNDNIMLYFHGDGHSLEALRKYSQGMANIFFTGRYKHFDLERLYNTSDIVWAAYPNLDYNVKYAISNKFHESLFYGVPCIFSDKTKLGDLVKEECIGFVVDPYDVNSIKQTLLHLLHDYSKLEEVKRNMNVYALNEKSWEEEFLQIKTVINQFL